MAKQQSTPAATAAAPKAIVPYDFSQDAGVGMENVKSDDLAIPFLVMLQSGSPEVKKSHKDYMTKGIPGALEGHIINSLGRKILNPDITKDRIKFIPCGYQKLYVEWTPRDSGGGLVQSHADASILSQCHKNEKGQDTLPNGNIVVTTAYFFGLVIDEAGDPTQCVLSMTSTQLKKARQWLSTATAIKFDGPNGRYNPPLFSHFYWLSSVPESNDQGSWMGWKVEMGGRVDDPVLVDNGRKAAQSVKSGQARLAPPAQNDTEI